jgi:hypothetical protein
MSIEVAPLEDDKLIGQTLANRYQIEVRLGEGAMGTVYRARHVTAGRSPSRSSTPSSSRIARSRSASSAKPSSRGACAIRT